MLRCLFGLSYLLLLLVGNSAVAKETIRLGVVTTPGTAQYLVAEEFKRLLQERTDGGYSVTILHSGSLGSETEILQQIRMNAVQMGVITLGPFDVFAPEVKVVNFPFLFNSHEQADRILDGPLGVRVLQALEKAGFKGLAFSENGFRHLTNDVRPVASASDVKGLKIRVMESVLHKELWRTLGANPTPMAWPIYTELRQGAVDGQENPLSIVLKYKLFEVQRHLSLTGHVYSAHISVANIGWFNKQPEDVRALMVECIREAAVKQRRWNRENQAAFLKELQDKGMNVVERPDAASFRAEAQRLKDMDIYAEPSVRELLDDFLDAVR